MAEELKKGRPVLVWVIFVYFVFSAGFTALSFLLILSGAMPLDANTQEYMDNLSTLDYLMTIGFERR